jgi:hypothetical protein
MRSTCATGTSWSSTIQTGRPFESCRFCTAGSFSDGAAPGFGGKERSGTCGGAAVAMVVPSAIEAARTRTARVVIVG